jgi:hypothetical protein
VRVRVRARAMVRVRARTRVRVRAVGRAPAPPGGMGRFRGDSGEIPGYAATFVAVALRMQEAWGDSGEI